MTSRQQQTWAKAGYTIAVVLVAIGVISAITRYLLPHQWHIDLFAPLYGQEYTHQQMDVLAKTPINEALHRLGGAMYLIIGLLQLHPAFRKKSWRLHRQLGRVFIILSVAVGVSAMVWAVVAPFGGFPQSVPTFFFALIFVVAACKAYVHARNRNFQSHREWIVRCFHLGVGISTIRVLFFILDHTVPLEDRVLLPVAFWLGWSIHLLIAEWWIQTTRPHARPARALEG